MKNLLYIFIVLFCSCGYFTKPDINEELEEVIHYEYRNDTINKIININYLPYQDSILFIYSDSFLISNDSVLIYKSNSLYINSLNNYRIEKCSFEGEKKTIQLVHMPYEREYWCAGDFYLKSINIQLIKYNNYVDSKR